jgi:hypothetical protein
MRYSECFVGGKVPYGINDTEIGRQQRKRLNAHHDKLSFATHCVHCSGPLISDFGVRLASLDCCEACWRTGKTSTPLESKL